MTSLFQPVVGHCSRSATDPGGPVLRGVAARLVAVTLVGVGLLALVAETNIGRGEFPIST